MIKGRNLVLAEHVRDVEEHRKNNQSFLIKSRIIRQTSVHATPYSTSLNINVARCVTDCQCNCVYNQSKKCKHNAASIYFINNKESSSKKSCEQQWGKPSARQFAKNKYSKREYFEKIAPRKYIQLNKPQEVHLSELIGDSPLKQILKAKVEKTNIHTVKNLMNSLLMQVLINLEKKDCAECLNYFSISCEEHFIYKRNYELDTNVKDFYIKNIAISEKKIVDLSCETLRQSSCDEWYKARRLRFSASTNVHSIKVRSRKSIDTLVSGILSPQKINCALTRYGLKHKSDAKEKYEGLNNCIVKRVGVVVSQSQPWLCASLDGVVVKDGCITKLEEFKCPISCEKKPVINLVDKSCNVKYLQIIDDKLILKKTDPYYTQIQVQMYVSGMTVGDLFVYSPVPNGHCTVQVHRDEEFLQIVISRSENFYFQHYLPALDAASIAKINEVIDENNTVRNMYDNTKINMFNNDHNNNDKTISPMRCFSGNNICNKIE